MQKGHSHNQIVTCLFGDPVEHSVSDFMFRYFAKLTKIANYNHLKFRIPKNDSENLKLAMRALKVFGMVGANITLPYKEDAIKYLDVVDKTVRLIGAVNTIVNDRGKLVGYNTDGYGAIKAIETKLKSIESSDRVVVFGSGGAARAIIGSLPKVYRITILSRASDSKSVRKIKLDFSHRGLKLDTKLITDANIVFTIKEASLVINATPVGMFPKGRASLINKHHLASIGKHVIEKYVFLMRFLILLKPNFSN
ncbi:MAG: hypothetical protein ABII16_02995 [Patescibacteria group bacterium]